MAILVNDAMLFRRLHWEYADLMSFFVILCVSKAILQRFCLIPMHNQTKSLQPISP